MEQPILIPHVKNIQFYTENLNAIEIIRLLKLKKIKLSYKAKELIVKSDIFPIPNPKVKVVIISTRDLGFIRGADNQEIYIRGIEKGMKLFDLELALQFRLCYKNQPLKEKFKIAMKPIFSFSGSSMIFLFKHCNSGRWLDAIYGHPEDHSLPNSRWAFLENL
jgi:hypothetical protein